MASDELLLTAEELDTLERWRQFPVEKVLITLSDTRRVLKAHEWVCRNTDTLSLVCGGCGRQKVFGHKPDCWLAALLAPLETEGGSK